MDANDRNRRWATFAATIPRREVNDLVEAMRQEVPELADGQCRSALYALALAGFWPAKHGVMLDEPEGTVPGERGEA